MIVVVSMDVLVVKPRIPEGQHSPLSGGNTRHQRLSVVFVKSDGLRRTEGEWCNLYGVQLITGAYGRLTEACMQRLLHAALRVMMRHFEKANAKL